MRSTVPAPEGADVAPAHQSRPTLIGVAWKTIIVLIVLSVALVIAAYLGAQSRPQVAERPLPAIQPVFEAPQGLVERWTRRAAEVAAQAVQRRLEETLDGVFAPVHAAVPAYADFHYSVLGEYVELTEAATRSVSSSMQEMLFDGFDERLGRAIIDLGHVYAVAFQQEFDTQVEADRSSFDEEAVLGAVTRAIVSDTIARARTGLPAEVLALSAGAVGAKTVAAALGKSLMKAVAKVAAKSAAKPLGAGGAAAVGAGAGSLLGPVGTIAGGIIGPGAGWLLMDFAVVKIDEFMNRDTFEADLHALIDIEKEALRQRIEDTIAIQAQATPGQTIEDVRAGSGSK